MSAPDISKGIGGIMVRGTMLMAVMRWGMRLTGLLSTIVLARLLLPEDFGIVAMAAALMGLLDGFVNLGVDLALIQNRQAGRKEYDTAWTIRLGQTILVAGVLLALAPFAAAFYDEPRVEPVAWAMAGLLLLRGLANIGVVDFRRDLRFGREFIYQFSGKAGRAVIAISAAFVLESHWALVLGLAGGNLTTVILSYAMSPYRPRPSLAAFKALWSFSQWMLLYNLAHVLGAQGGRFLVGGFAPTAVMGAYTVGFDLASMPTKELGAPVQRTVGPGLAHIKENRSRTSNALSKSMAMMALLVFPAGFGVFAIAEPFVAVILGGKWLQAVPFVEAAAFAGMFGATATIPSTFLMVCDHIKRAALTRGLWTSLLLIPAYPLLTAYGAIGFAYYQAFVSLVACLAYIAQMCRAADLPAGPLLAPLARPLAAAVAMAIGVRWLIAELPYPPPAALAIGVTAGGLVFAASLLALWLASGRPEGAEATLFRGLRTVCKRRHEPVS